MKRHTTALTALALVAAWAPLASGRGPALSGPAAASARAEVASSPRPGSPAPPDEAFRAAPPPAAQGVSSALPQVEQAVLDNGVRVLLVEQHELPIADVRILVRRGAADALPGVAIAAAALLFSGSREVSKDDIGRKLGELHVVSGQSFHAMALSIRAMSADLQEALPTMCSLLQRPLLPNDDFERVRARKGTLAAESRGDIDRLVEAVLFPSDHPYALSPEGERLAYRGLERSDVAAFFEHQVRPDQVVVVGAGDISMGMFKQMVRDGFSHFRGKASAPTDIVLPRESPSERARVKLLARRGATQAEVRVAALVGPPDSPDRPALELLNHLLGRGLTGRLSATLRAHHGYAYDAGSYFWSHRGGGAFVLGTAVAPETATDTIDLMLRELDRLRREPMTSEELKASKLAYASGLARRFESVSATVHAISELVEDGLPIDAYPTRLRAVSALTAEQVQVVARKYLSSERLRIVVAADAGLRDALARVGSVEIVPSAF